MSAPVLIAERVGIRFGGLRALDDFSIEIAQGEIQGLIGPNGAGKTTLFNVLTGVYPASSGQVRVAGKNIAGKRPYQITELALARTFQNIRLFKALSVLDNVKVASLARAARPLFPQGNAVLDALNSYYDWWRALLLSSGYLEEERRVTESALALLEVMGLAHRSADLAGSLPYGEQRRLEIARALATQPKVILLDEPAAGMNTREKAELMTMIRGLRERYQLGILLIDHDMKLVMGICERITVLDHGETIATGTPSEVQRNPDVIAAYLGAAPPPRSQSLERTAHPARPRADAPTKHEPGGPT